jgi:hypothetical protein|tara:strand:+ start:841 stop:984 length:144 start_codon:yes stop_codon:yes gene_type:complete
MNTTTYSKSIQRHTIVTSGNFLGLAWEQKCEKCGIKHYEFENNEKEY